MSAREQNLTPEREMSPDELIDYVGRQYQIPAGLRHGLFKQESGKSQYAASGRVKTSSVGARGFGQLMPATAKQIGVNPDDPVENVVGSAHYLRSLYDQARPHSTDDSEGWAKAVAGYFSGPGNMSRQPGQVYLRDHSDGAVRVSQYVTGVLSKWADHKGIDNDWDSPATQFAASIPATRPAQSSVQATRQSPDAGVARPATEAPAGPQPPPYVAPDAIVEPQVQAPTPEQARAQLDEMRRPPVQTGARQVVRQLRRRPDVAPTVEGADARPAQMVEAPRQPTGQPVNAVRVQVSPTATADDLALQAYKNFALANGVKGDLADSFARDAFDAAKAGRGQLFDASFLKSARHAGAANVEMTGPALDILNRYLGGQESGRNIETQMSLETGVEQPAAKEALDTAEGEFWRERGFNAPPRTEREIVDNPNLSESTRMFLLDSVKTDSAGGVMLDRRSPAFGAYVNRQLEGEALRAEAERLLTPEDKKEIDARVDALLKNPKAYRPVHEALLRMTGGNVAELAGGFRTLADLTGYGNRPADFLRRRAYVAMAAVEEADRQSPMTGAQRAEAFVSNLAADLTNIGAKVGLVGPEAAFTGAGYLGARGMGASPTSSAVQGAKGYATAKLFGATEGLPLPQRVPTVFAGSYGLSRATGADNRQAVEEAAANTAFSVLPSAVEGVGRAAKSLLGSPEPVPSVAPTERTARQSALDMPDVDVPVNEDFQSPRVVKASQAETDTTQPAQPPSPVSEELGAREATPTEAVRHVDVQARRRRTTANGREGQFRKETKAEAETRRAQVGSPQIPEEVDAPDSSINRSPVAPVAAEQMGEARPSREVQAGVEGNGQALTAAPALPSGVEYLNDPHLPEGTTIRDNGGIWDVKLPDGTRAGANQNRAQAIKNAVDKYTVSGDFALDTQTGEAVYSPDPSATPARSEFPARPVAASDAEAAAHFKRRGAPAPKVVDAETVPVARPSVATVPEPPKGVDFGKGLTRNYQAGMNRSSITFGSLEQRDLFDLYSKMRLKTRNESRADAQMRVQRVEQEASRLSDKLGVPRESMMKVAGDVYDDVRAQMRGVKDGESRTIVDNVRSAPKSEQQSVAPVPDAKAFRAQMKSKFNLSDDMADVTEALGEARANAWAKEAPDRKPEDYYAARFGGIVRGGEASSDALRQEAWHGSPHEFGRFDSSKIGTGEGNQTYGHGLYFTDTKDVAEHYKNTLANRNFTYQGKPVGVYGDLREAFPGASDTFVRVLEDVRNHVGFGLRSALSNVRQEYETMRHGATGARRKLASELLKQLEGMRPHFEQKAEARLYKVDLAPKEDEYLLWDKPLNEQSEKVKEAARQHFERRGFNLEAAMKMRGSEFYEYAVSSQQRGEVARQDARLGSEYLKSLGIRGIKYLDGSSRGEGEGSHNYVIFDDADVSIKEVLRQQHKAAVEFMQDGRAVIRAFQKADVSSAWHEMAHVFRRDLSAELLKDAESALSIKDGNWTKEHDERFARGFERYLKTGEAPTVKLRRVFEAAKAWLTEIYGAVRGKNHPLKFKPNEQLTAVFDRMLGGEPKGEFGQLIHALHKAPDEGTPAFFENAQVKRVLRLRPDASTADVRAALTEAAGKPRSSHLNPEDITRWADSKGLNESARKALDFGISKYKETVKEPTRYETTGVRKRNIDPSTQSLSEFVRASGGIRVDRDRMNRGELAALTNKESGTSGLVRKDGRSVYDMAQMAAEAGYPVGTDGSYTAGRSLMGEVGTDYAHADTFLDMLSRDLGDEKVYSSEREVDFEEMYRKEHPEDNTDALDSLLATDRGGTLYDKVSDGTATRREVEEFKSVASEHGVFPEHVAALIRQGKGAKAESVQGSAGREKGDGTDFNFGDDSLDEGRPDFLYQSDHKPQQLGFVNEGLAQESARREQPARQFNDAKTEAAKKALGADAYAKLSELKNSPVARIAHEVGKRVNQSNAENAPDVLKALSTLAELKRTKQTVSDYLKQDSLFGGRELSRKQEQILSRLDANPRKVLDEMFPAKPEPTQDVLFQSGETGRHSPDEIAEWAKGYASQIGNLRRGIRPQGNRPSTVSHRQLAQAKSFSDKFAGLGEPSAELVRLAREYYGTVEGAPRRAEIARRLSVAFERFGASKGESEQVTQDTLFQADHTAASRRQRAYKALLRERQPDLFDEMGRPKLDKRTPLKKGWDATMNALGLARALQTLAPFHASFRHTKMGLSRHPVEWGKAFYDSVKALKPSAYREIVERMKADETYPLAKKYGLSLTSDFGDKTGLENREEAFQSNWIHKIPGIKHSDQSFTTMVNVMRFGWFKQYVKYCERLGLDPAKAADGLAFKQGAELVNSATGRGTLPGNLDRAAPALNNVFFSTRFWASRLKMLSIPFDPRSYLSESRGGLSKPVRVEAFKTLFNFTALVGAQLALAKLSGAHVGTSPDDPDFLKASWGKLHVDLSAGMQGHIKTGIKLMRAVGGNEGSRQTFGDIINQYVRAKEAPIPKFLHDVANGRDAGGQPVYAFGEPGQGVLHRVRTSAALRTFTPMMAADALKGFGDSSLAEEGAAVASKLFGEGGEIYESKQSGGGRSATSRPAFSRTSTGRAAKPRPTPNNR